MKKGEEAMGRKSIAVYRTGTQGGGENLNVSVKKLLAWMGRRGRRVWVAARVRREILGEDQVGLEGMAGSCHVVEQTSEGDEVDAARATGQRRILAAEAAEPAKQMGVTAEL